MGNVGAAEDSAKPRQKGRTGQVNRGLCKQRTQPGKGLEVGKHGL